MISATASLRRWPAAHTLLLLVIGLFIGTGPNLTEANSALPRVASINLCADQLVMSLAQRVQVVSLSRLSHDPAASHYATLARQYPTNDGTAETVIHQKPDIVIAGEFSSRHTINLLRRAQVRVEILPIAHSIDELLSNLHQVAQWLEVAEKGSQMVSDLQNTLDRQSIRRERDRAQHAESAPPRAAVYDPNGYTVGRQSLRGESMERAGWHNVATDAGIEAYGSLSLESIVRLAPQALIESPFSKGTWSRAQAMNQHPALKERGLQPTTIALASADTICAGPWVVDLIDTLAEALPTAVR